MGNGIFKCNQKFLTVRQMAQLTQVIELLSKLDLTWCHNFIALAHFQHLEIKQIKNHFRNSDKWQILIGQKVRVDGAVTTVIPDRIT